MKPLDFKSVLQIILKRWWIILISVLLCSTAAVVASLFLMVPVYESNATLYIVKVAENGGHTDIQYNDLLIGSQLVKDYRELVKSRLVANQVLKELGLEEISIKEFSGKLNVELKNDTRIIQISATDFSPVMAMKIADKVTEVFIEKVVEIMQAENVKVIDRAEVPIDPVKPNKVMNTAVGLVLGFAVGLVIAFFVEFLDNTVKTAEDIKEYLNLPVIGTVPVLSKRMKGITNRFDSMAIITHEQPKSPIAEAYRVLRTNILFSSIDRPLKSLAVTSSGSNEGKTTTIVNLAVAFSQKGNRVLLIDGDLRKPKIHHIFGLENDNGLTNFLSTRNDYRKYIAATKVENLYVLVCGTIPPNPSELLMSNTMKKFIQQVREDYDMVLMDAPPVGIVTDAAIISTIVDGTILVAASGVVAMDAMVRSKELLNKVNANIIGVLLNKIDRNLSDSNYYQSYYDEEVDIQKKEGQKKQKKKKEQKALRTQKKQKRQPVSGEAKDFMSEGVKC